MDWLGDFPEDFTTVTWMLTSFGEDGNPIAPLTAFEAADFKIYKNGSTTPKSSMSGVTVNSPHNSITGLHSVVVDTNDNTDVGYWVAGALYQMVLSPNDETVDGVAVLATAQFGIELMGAKIAAIKAKTDNLPADPADASDIASAFSTVNTKLDAIDDFVDTEVSAIKAKTDSLTFTSAGKVDANIIQVNSTAVAGTGAPGDEWGPV